MDDRGIAYAILLWYLDNLLMFCGFFSRSTGQWVVLDIGTSGRTSFRIVLNLVGAAAVLLCSMQSIVVDR